MYAHPRHKAWALAEKPDGGLEVPQTGRGTSARGRCRLRRHVGSTEGQQDRASASELTRAESAKKAVGREVPGVAEGIASTFNPPVAGSSPARPIKSEKTREPRSGDTRRREDGQQTKNPKVVRGTCGAHARTQREVASRPDELEQTRQAYSPRAGSQAPPRKVEA